MYEFRAKVWHFNPEQPSAQKCFEIGIFKAATHSDACKAARVAATHLLDDTRRVASVSVWLAA